MLRLFHAAVALWTVSPVASINHGGRLVLYPDGGAFTSPIAVSVSFTPASNSIRIFYSLADNKFETWDKECCPSASDGAFSVSQEHLIEVATDAVLSIVAYDSNGALIASHKSAYSVARGRYGYGYLVPNYNDKIGFSGILTRVDLRSPPQRIAQNNGFNDFALYETELGKGAFDYQVQQLDLQQIDPELKGFYGGFSAVAHTGNDTQLSLLSDEDRDKMDISQVTVKETWTNFAFLVPYNNGAAHGKVARVNLDYFSLCATSKAMRGGKKLDVFEPKEGLWSKQDYPYGRDNLGLKKPPPSPFIDVNTSKISTVRCGVHFLDLPKEVDPSLKGFAGGFSAGPYGFLVPNFNGVNFSGTVVRFELSNFSASTTRTLDLTKIDHTLRGFTDGFMHNGWAYLVPYRRNTGSVEGVSSKHPADRNHLQTEYHGNLVRFDPYQFSLETVGILDLASTVDDALRGFSGGCVVGRYAILAPFMRRDAIAHGVAKSPGENPFSSKVVRVDLAAWDGVGKLPDDEARNRIVTVLDMTDVDPTLRGYQGAFCSGTNAYLIPYVNGHLNFRRQTGFGKLVQVDVSKFHHGVHAAVTVIDLPTRQRMQVPPTPDHNLRGFVGGFAAGDYGYLIPSFNGDFHGRLVRFHLKLHDVQMIDLQLDNATLAGFMGGFTHRDRAICCNELIGHRTRAPLGQLCQPLSRQTSPYAYCGSREFTHAAVIAADPLPMNGDRKAKDGGTELVIIGVDSGIGAGHDPTIMPRIAKTLLPKTTWDAKVALKLLDKEATDTNLGSPDLRKKAIDGAVSLWETLQGLKKELYRTTLERMCNAGFQGNMDVMNRAAMNNCSTKVQVAAKFQAQREWYRTMVERESIPWAEDSILTEKRWVDRLENLLIPNSNGSAEVVMGQRRRVPLNKNALDWLMPSSVSSEVARDYAALAGKRVVWKEQCCHFVDQHQVEYVLWDRRAYQRGWKKKVTQEIVEGKTCLFQACEDNPNF